VYTKEKEIKDVVKAELYKNDTDEFGKYDNRELLIIIEE
jgi:hypothetical protein